MHVSKPFLSSYTVCASLRMMTERDVTTHNFPYCTYSRAMPNKRKAKVVWI